jgi:hypothetical protein
VRPADQPDPLFHAARATDAIVSHRKKLRGREFCSLSGMPQRTTAPAPGRKTFALWKSRNDGGAKSFDSKHCQKTQAP